MISKVVKKIDINKDDSIREDLKYWLEKDPSERILAVESLRRQFYGNTSVYFIGLDQFIKNRRSIGRKKDMADLEALGID